MNYKIFERAIALAKTMKGDISQRYTVFSFIYRKNQIYAVGGNDMTKTHTAAYYNNYEYPYLHSELAAIRAFKDIDNSYRYNFLNIRLDRSGKLRNSMPCKYCQSILDLHNFKSLTYSVDNGFTFRYSNEE
jgi:hypothetical protein